MPCMRESAGRSRPETRRSDRARATTARRRAARRTARARRDARGARRGTRRPRPGARARPHRRPRDRGGAAQEAHDLDEESPVPRRREQAPLGEHRRQRRAAPLDAAARHRERHRRRARRDAELGEQRAKLRIGRAVVHDETHVDRGAIRRIERQHVTARARRGLEQRDVVRARERPRRREPRDPRADDRDLDPRGHRGRRSGSAVIAIGVAGAVPCASRSSIDRSTVVPRSAAPAAGDSGISSSRAAP